MNTHEGRYLSVREAIEAGILLREVRCLTLIEVLDFGMYQPHSGKILVPGRETEVTLAEAIETQVVDITKTLIKSRKTQKFITTQESIRIKDVDSLTGMYGNINLLEARNKGYIMTIDTMVSLKGAFQRFFLLGESRLTDARSTKYIAGWLRIYGKLRTTIRE